MGNKFKEKVINIGRRSIAVYYRLELHNILINVDRIIWLDGDTLIFGDLSELIALDMRGNYILGFLDNNLEALKEFNITNGVIICSGVLLMDLDALRKNNISEKYNKFLKENFGRIKQHDQTTINFACQGKISALPPKYGIWNFPNVKLAIDHNNIQLPYLKYNENDFIFSYYYPVILHYVQKKPFLRDHTKIFYDEWWKYAKKTGFYDEISKNFTYH